MSNKLAVKETSLFALSSTEVEYYAQSLVAAEVKFVTSLVQEVTGESETPNLLKEHSMGAIYLVKNHTI
jgi:hypothetical protein